MLLNPDTQKSLCRCVPASLRFMCMQIPNGTMARWHELTKVSVQTLLSTVAFSAFGQAMYRMRKK